MWSVLGLLHLPGTSSTLYLTRLPLSFLFGFQFPLVSGGWLKELPAKGFHLLSVHGRNLISALFLHPAKGVSLPLAGSSFRESPDKEFLGKAEAPCSLPCWLPPLTFCREGCKWPSHNCGCLAGNHKCRQIAKNPDHNHMTVQCLGMAGSALWAVKTTVILDVKQTVVIQGLPIVTKDYNIPVILICNSSPGIFQDEGEV